MRFASISRCSFREVGSLSDDTENMTARELLDRTADVADDWLSQDPDLRQQVKAVLGEIMIALNDYAAAEPLLEDFAASDLGTDNPLLQSIAVLDMAQVHHRQGRVEQGLTAAEKAVGILESLPGTHPARMSDALQIRGRLYRDLGRWDEALADLRRARELALEVSSGPRPLMARAENNLATTLLIGAQLEEAARHFEAAEALWIALGRGDSSDALAVTGNLGSVLDRVGRSDEAEQRLRRVIRIREEKYGPSGAMAAARLNLGRLLVVQGDLDEAGTHLQLAADVFARFIGEDTPDHAAAQLGLGELAQARGRSERALELYRQSRDTMTALLGPSHPYSLQTRLAELNARRTMNAEFNPDEFTALAEDAESAGRSGRSVLSMIACDRARFEIERDRIEAALAQAESCLDLRQDLGLAGWRITEAEALIALAESPDGTGGANFRRQVERLAIEMNPDHPAVRWFDRFEGRRGG